MFATKSFLAILQLWAFSSPSILQLH